MKPRFILLSALLYTGALAGAEPPAAPAAPEPSTRTFSSFDRPRPGEGEETFPAGTLKFESAAAHEVLQAYQQMSRRSVISAGGLASAPITFRNEHPLTRREALQALDTVLAEHGIVMIPLGTRYVKAVLPKQAVTEPAPVVEGPAEQLPESNSYLTYIVELKNQRANSIMPMLQPFARMPNSIVTGGDGNNLLILRDYSVNVRRMLLVIERLELEPPIREHLAPAKRRPAGANALPPEGRQP